MFIKAVTTIFNATIVHDDELNAPYKNQKQQYSLIFNLRFQR